MIIVVVVVIVVEVVVVMVALRERLVEVMTLSALETLFARIQSLAASI